MPVPPSRIDPRSTGQTRRACFTSLAQLQADEDLDRQKRVQDLLDQRWKRWRSMIRTALAAGAAVPIAKALGALLTAIGAW